MKNHFELMSEYNRRINEQIYSATSHLKFEEYSKDMGLFFGSIHGTLNHIMVGDLIWLRRFSSIENKYPELARLDMFPKPTQLTEELFNDFPSLRKARRELDEIIQHWVNRDLKESDFTKFIDYKNTQNVLSSRNFAELLHHLFNHQTHHRGQVSTALSQLGRDIGATDFLTVIPNRV